VPPEPPVIRSRSHPLLKRVGAARAGKLEDVLVLEGERLVRDALEAGWRIATLLLAESRGARAADWHAAGAAALDVRLVQDDLLARASALASSPGLLALAELPAARRLEQLDFAGQPLFLAVAGVADPGNLGALARSAEAAGARALLVVAGGARPFGEKSVRGSMGSLLRLPVVLAGDAAQLSRELALRGARQVAAVARGGASWRAFDWSGPLVLWVTGETGAPLDPGVRAEAVSIPMAGRVESLNVTVAASLLLFAAARVGGTR